MNESNHIETRKRLSIALVTMQAVFEAPGGIESYTLNLHNALRNMGYDSTIVCRKLSTPFPISKKTISNSELKDNYAFKFFSKGSNFLYAILLIFFSFFLFLKLLVDVKKFKYDLIHTQDPFFSGIAASLVSRITGVPSIIHVHGSFHLPSTIKFGIGELTHWIYYRSVLKIGRNFIVTDSTTADIILRHGVPKTRISILPTFVSNRFFENKSCVRKEGTTLQVGYVGRLTAVKRIETIIDAIHELKLRGLDVQCILVGDGEKTRELTQQVMQYDLEQYIQFVGTKSNVIDYLHKMDVFVLPSESEGCPVALLEAMAVGLPVILSDISPLRDIDAEKILTFFPLGNAEILANELEKLVHDTNVRIQLAESSVRTSEAFRQEIVLEQTVQKYREILDSL